ncbi:transcriptional regulator [Methylobacterium sp. J-043]|jgi:DNA-binding HxlR family transcriptional regulator|uniref:transcriptional regulator n=1 Tax=Methylorubrum TaxID=2282523 RepID=UPI0020A1D1B5|nr:MULTISPECIES: transcriptional regulator [Methylorubrum]MCJ2032474.1 transcriptional regulator [Methylobacterium sp. J-043]MCP1549894.1 DNA-binding HxlR family transcriptional regulator [Methylorubrum zatmanii]MCP1553492.1 DNA-binding HxlR family transcriptional regulator [Methylorubrum extorquens]MCP1580196.1 DNA-binding HxlR family transcriptional regulator [Methylorubrum extorquens]
MPTSDRSDARFSYEGLDRIIHERARLSVLTSLVSHPRGLAFPDLKRLCGLTDGNLSRHLAVLQEADLVSLEKGYDQNRPQTLCRLTPSGRSRFLDYLGVLEQVVRDAAQAAGKPQNAAGRSQAAEDRPAAQDRSGLAEPV